MDNKTSKGRPSFLQHVHPPTIPEAQARWRYTLGAGGIALFLALILGISGALEMFFYIPTSDEAAISIQRLSYLVPFGGLVRNIHFWSAQLLVIISSIHLLRVVFTGSYSNKRKFNYLLGLGLFLLVILLDFTGYILRWDTGIQWALVVGTNLIKTIPWIGNKLYPIVVGSQSIGSETLIRFYSWHIFGLIIPAMILIVWHVFKVRRDGGIAVPPAKLRENQRRISRVELVRMEILAMIITGVVLLILSILFPAPIAQGIKEITTLSGDASAPWFFLWVQQMLKWGDPFKWGVLVPVIFFVFTALIPYVLPKPADQDLGKWFPKSNRLAQIALGSITIVISILTILGLNPAA